MVDIQFHRAMSETCCTSDASISARKQSVGIGTDLVPRSLVKPANGVPKPPCQFQYPMAPRRGFRENQRREALPVADHSSRRRRYGFSCRQAPGSQRGIEVFQKTMKRLVLPTTAYLSLLCKDQVLYKSRGDSLSRERQAQKPDGTSGKPAICQALRPPRYQNTCW